MRKVLITLALAALAAPMAMLPGLANAKGCLKGAAVGGVAGHVAGHHGVVGAAAGCAIEHHREKVKGKAAAQKSQPAPDNDPSDPRTSTSASPK